MLKYKLSSSCFDVNKKKVVRGLSDVIDEIALFGAESNLAYSQSRLGPFCKKLAGAVILKIILLCINMISTPAHPPGRPRHRPGSLEVGDLMTNIRST